MTINEVKKNAILTISRKGTLANFQRQTHSDRDLLVKKAGIMESNHK